MRRLTQALSWAILAALFTLPALACAQKTRAATTPPAGLRAVEDVIRDAHAGVTFIQVDALERRIDANPRLVVLDVRTAREFDAAHLKGAAWVERGIAEFVLLRKLPDPDVEIVVYCKAGHRSGLVVKALRAVGYRHVVALAGGFDAWANQGNRVVNHLGEFKAVRLIERNASAHVVDFFEGKR